MKNAKNMAKLTILLIILLIASCDNSGTEQYVELREGIDLKSVQVEFMDSYESLNDKYDEIYAMASKDSIKYEKVDKPSQRRGFHVDWGDFSVIYIIKPSKLNFKEWSGVLGHEFSHELFGKFHKPHEKIKKLKFYSGTYQAK